MRLVVKETLKLLPGEAKPQEPQIDPGAWDEKEKLGPEWQTGEEATKSLAADQEPKLKLVIKNK